MTIQPDIHIIITATGASKRLGSPKQDIEFHGKPLWQTTADIAQVLGYPITLITGAWRPSGPFNSTISELHFPGWSNGHSETIAYAAKYLSKPRVGYLILAVDQWGLTSQSLLGFVEAWNKEDIQLAADDAYTGLPALIPVRYHKKLLKLQGDHSIKPLTVAEHIRRIQLPHASWVVNTPEDQFLMQQLMEDDSYAESV